MGNKHNDEAQQLIKQLRDQKFKKHLKQWDRVGKVKRQTQLGEFRPGLSRFV